MHVHWNGARPSPAPTSRRPSSTSTGYPTISGLAFDRLVTARRWDQAVDFVLALDEYAFFRLEYDKLGWQDQLVDVPAVADHPGFTRLLSTASLAAWIRDRFGPAGDLADRALAVAADRGEPMPVPALRAKLNVAAAQQDMNTAPGLLAQLVELADTTDNDRERADTRVNQVLAFTFMGMAEDAMRVAHEGLNAADRSRNPTTISWAKCGLGYAQVLTRPQAAMPTFSEALRLARTVQNRWIAATALSGLASSARLSGRPEEAGGILATLIDRWVVLNKESFMARDLNEVALVLADLGRHDDAREVLSWANSFPADSMFLPDDRRRVHQLNKELTPALVPDLVNPKQIAAQASLLLHRAGATTVHNL